MKKYYKKILASSLTLLMQPLIASELTVNMFSTDDKNKNIGKVHIKETKNGLLLTPNLKNLKPGIHGFHIHSEPNCGKHGMNAKGHLDPKNTNKHLGPYNDSGHLGDLPAIYVKKDNTASTPVLAPKIKKIENIKNKSLMIHEGGDNYSDSPKKLGGGGARVACGVIKD